MPAKELGSKHVCFKCATKFYDLKKPEALCPKCGADQRQSPANRPTPEPRKGRLAAVPKVIEPVVPVEPEGVAEEEELETFEDEAEVEEDEA
jgi:uncharacterized protein (TIGR02300 family)